MDSCDDDDNGPCSARKDQRRIDKPFIQFRKFADEQFGLLLQGFIGLPSALGRLPDLGCRLGLDDEHMMPRPDLERADDTDSPYTDVGGAVSSSPFTNGASYTPLSQSVNQVTRDLPLYSSVRGNLFQRAALKKLLGMPQLPQVISEGRLVQLWAYDAYREGYWGCAAHSPPSLIGYLLNSPYSPVHLTSYSEGGTPDEFPYHAAFDDLITTTLGMSRPSSSAIIGVPHRTVHANSSAMYSIQWITALHAHLKLLPDRVSEWSRFVHAQYTERPGIRRTILDQIYERAALRPSEPSDMPSTEQAMYERYHEQDDEDDCVRPDFKMQGSEDIMEEAARSLQQQANVSVQTRAPFEAQNSRGEVEKTSRPSDPNRVVATHKTVRQCTYEDGSSESQVEVTKRYADGRETTSTSSHAEEGQLRHGRASEKKTKGWFWS